MAHEVSPDYGGRNGYPIPDAEWHRSTSRDSKSTSRSHLTHSEGSESYEETEDSPPPSTLGAAGSSLHFFISRRHTNGGNPMQVEKKQPFWRMTGRSYKTTQGALIICLNIGCDPPDIVKTQPAAHLECWIDPHTMPPSKALETIGKALQNQFEILNSRGKYKSYLDPSLDDFKGYMISLRNHTKSNRALVYYNGHGVPKPTNNGEFWVFNRNYTQYIPVSLNDLQDWIRSPTLFIWDCSAAGNILHNFEKFAKPKDEEMRQLYPDGNFAADYVPLSECIHLLACGADEELPMAPDLPADVFTSCLTSPIKMALRFYVLQNNHRFPDATLESISHIPGDFKDRRTPFGELSWIFTAVTDTIAWSVFSPEIFRKYFRQDLTTASLFRNFLLAERVLRAYDCTPQSLPRLPPTHMHPMWRAWDLAVDSCLAQLPEILRSLGSHLPDPRPLAPDAPLPYRYVPSVFFAEHLTAFEVWLKRGKILNEASGERARIFSMRPRGCGPEEAHEVENHRRPPEQLPVLLQVLLSQAHRLRALILLSQFMDLGPWAVHYALEIGIFPYVLRLLQSSSPDVRPVLLFIWARILSADPSCKEDLAREIEIKDPQAQGENAPKLKVSPLKYFCEVLMPNGPVPLLIPNVSEHRAMAAFCLSVIVRDHIHGQERAFIHGAFEQCMFRLDDDDFLLRQWSILCLANLWAERDDYKALAMEHSAHDKVMEMLHDISPEVRASATYALGTFLGASSSPDPSHRSGGGTGLLPFNPRDQFRVEIAIGTRAMLAGRDDASPIVRKELIVLLSALVVEWKGWFTIAAWIYWEWDKVNRAHIPDVGRLFMLEADGPEEGFAAIHRIVSEWIHLMTLADPRADRDFDLIKEENRVLLSSFFTIWSALFDLSVDPYPEVAAMAKTVVDYLMACLVESAFARLPSSGLNSFPIRSSNDEAATIARVVTSSGHKLQIPRSRQSSLHANSATAMNSDQINATRHVSLQRSDSSMSTHALSSTLKRTSSIAASLKNLAVGHPFPLSEPGSPLPASPLLPSPDSIPLIAVTPEPGLNSFKYTSPWNLQARTKSLPSPSPSASLADARGSTVSAALSPSWKSLSPPNPSLGPSSLTFPSRDRAEPASRANGKGGKGSQLSAKSIMDALVEEDFERQRSRVPWDRKGEVQNYRSNSHKRHSSSLALGKLDTISDTLPLRSTYYDSCAEYYSESQMGLAEIEEPGSELYNEQMLKRLAAEKSLQDSADQAEMADSHAWDKLIATLPNDQNVSQLAFHPTENHLLIADRLNNIGLWDWASRRKICVFYNNNSPGSRITHLQYINNDYHTLVLSGSSDQVVRVFRNCNGGNDSVELVTAFRALNDRVPVKKGSGMVLAWQQYSGILLASGDVKAVRVWDSHRELCLQDVPTNAASSVTSLAFESDASQIFSVGHADGSVHVYDRRMRSGGYIRSCEGHQSWIQNVHWQKHGSREMISASVDGTVCLWDIRSPIPNTLIEPHSYGLESLAIHDEANIFATVTAITPAQWRQQFLTIYPPPDNFSFQPHLSSLGRTSIPTGRTAAPESIVPGLSPLAFHPNEMIIGTGGADCNIRLYGAKLESFKAPYFPVEFPRPSSPMAIGIGSDSF